MNKTFKMRQKQPVWQLMLFAICLLTINMQAQISYTSATQNQTDISTNQPYGQGTINQRILRLDISTGGSGTALSINTLYLSLTGSSEIAKLSVYNSTSTIYPNLSIPPFAEVNNPGNNEIVNLNGANITGSGTNRYWIIIDLKSNATIDNPIDVVCDSLVAGGVKRIKPTVSNDRNAAVSANLSGTFSVNTSGGNYSTLRSAINDANNRGIGTGGLELVLADDAIFNQVGGDYDVIYEFFRQPVTKTSPLTIRRSGTGTNKPIIISTATGSSADCILGFLGTDYVTIDGLEMRSTLNTLTTGLEFGIFFRGLPADGCSYNIVRNCSLDLNNKDRTRTYAIKFDSYSTVIEGTNNYNLIYGNTLKNADACINFNAQRTPVFNDANNDIYNNSILGNFGLEAGGISLQNCTDTKIYNNLIDGSDSLVTYNQTVKGINTTNANCSGYIYCNGNIIKNITNLSNGNNARVNGINIQAPVVHIYNNMVANLRCEFTTSTGRSAGIVLASSSTLNPYYYVWNNSVYLNQVTPTVHISAAILFDGNQSLNANMVNNIFVNTSTGAGNNYVFYSPNQAFSKLDASSDNNLYHPEMPSFINVGGTTFSKLASYKLSATNKDQSAISELPPFVSTTDLHLSSNITTRIEGGGKPLLEVTTDIDGESRHITIPDIGADEGSFKPLNHAPVMESLTNLGPMNNNEAEQIVNLKGISDSNPTTSQSITIVAKSSHPAVIPNPLIEYTQGSSTGVLKFTPTGSGKGKITITVKVMDDGGNDLGGTDSAIYTFEVNIIDPLVNNQPTINTIANLNIFSNSPEQTINLSGIDDGDLYKVQNLSLTATTSPEGIITQPMITYVTNQATGILKFSPKLVGSTTITIKVTDDGGHIGDNVDTFITTFIVNVRDFNTYAYSDRFDDGIVNWWVGKAGQYSITEKDDNLKVNANKNERWTSFGINLPTPVNVSESPYMFIRLKPSSAEYPFKLNAYIGDGKKSVNIQKRVMYADSAYTELFFDFTGLNVNLDSITTAFFAINGDALTWKGNAWIDQLDMGGIVAKSANICALRDLFCAPGTTNRKVIITDIENATSLSLTGGNSLIENVSISPISNKLSTLNFDIRSGITGKERITITAHGASGYADKQVSFWLTIEDNKAPSINQLENLNVEVNMPVEISLTGIDDGNSASVQPLSISAESGNPVIIPSATISYIEGQTKAKLKFTAASAGLNIPVTVKVNDGGIANNTTSMTFYVNSYNQINHPPVVDPLDNLNLVLSEGAKEIVLKGLGDGDNNTQDIKFEISSLTDSVVANNIAEVKYEPGQTEAAFTLTPLKPGATTITITLTDYGGDGSNNGNQTTSIQFDVNVLNDPLYGYVVPTNNFPEDLAKGVWSPQQSKYTMQTMSFDGFEDVIKVDMTNKSNWDGIWLNIPEVNVKDAPYMSMDVYPATQDLYWHVYFYDVDGNRNANGAHAERKLLTKNQWNSIVLDYRTDGYLLDNLGFPINTKRITDLMFNMHNPNFPFPFTTINGTFYLKNIRVGNQTIFPGTKATPTIEPVIDLAHIQEEAPTEKIITLKGISNGNFGTSGINISVTSSNPAIANPTVGSVSALGTAELRYTPGSIVGTTSIVLIVTAGSQEKRDTFNIAVVSNNTADALTLTIDTLTKYQTIRGFGTFQNEYRFADLYANEMGSSAVRIGFISNQFETENDNADPNVTDYSKLNRDVFNWDYLRELRDRGVEDFVLTSWSPPAWMKGNLSLDYMQGGAQGNSDATDNKLEYHLYDEFAEMMVAFCKVFEEEMGMELTGIGLQNEPAFHEPYASAILDIPRFVQLIKVVAPRLQAAGISTKIFMPEQVFSQGSNSMSEYIDALQADAVANPLCTVIATHGYASDGIGAGSPDFSQWTTMWNNCQEGAYPKELWMTETFKEYKVYEDAMYMANAIFGSVVAGNVSHWTTWAFTGAYFDTKSNKPTSMLYTTRNFSKFIRPGAKRISGVVTGSSNVLGSAFLNEKSDKGTVVSVLINNGLTPQTVKISGTSLPMQYDVYQTTEGLDCELTGKVASTDVVLLPAKSVTTLVGSYGNQPPLIDPIKDIAILNSSAEKQTLQLTGISDGNLGVIQDITITAISSNPALIPHPTVNYVQGEETAVLNYSHLGGTLGSAKITLKLMDNGGITDGSNDSLIISFNISVVKEVNLMPQINSVPPQTIDEDAVNPSVSLTGISDGDDLFEQPLTIDATSDNPALITSIKVNYTVPNETAALNYTVAPNASGIANITITVNDHGGTTFNNGDLQKTVNFTITVLANNDIPGLDSIANQTVLAYSEAHTINLTGITDGDTDETQNLTVSVTATNQSDYFSNLSVSYTQGNETAILNYTPKGLAGSSIVTVTVRDNGGTTNGGIDTRTRSFNIDFTPVTGNNEVRSEDVKLYPNPVKDILTVTLPTGIYKNYEVYNTTGTLVEYGSIAKSTSSITILANKLANGIYLIRLTGIGASANITFVVK